MNDYGHPEIHDRKVLRVKLTYFLPQRSSDFAAKFTKLQIKINFARRDWEHGSLNILTTKEVTSCCILVTVRKLNDCFHFECSSISVQGKYQRFL